MQYRHPDRLALSVFRLTLERVSESGRGGIGQRSRHWRDGRDHISHLASDSVGEETTVRHTRRIDSSLVDLNFFTDKFQQFANELNIVDLFFSGGWAAATSVPGVTGW